MPESETQGSNNDNLATGNEATQPADTMIIGIAVGATLSICVVMAGAAALGCYCSRRQKYTSNKRRHGQYINEDDDDNNEKYDVHRPLTVQNDETDGSSNDMDMATFVMPSSTGDYVALPVMQAPAATTTPALPPKKASALYSSVNNANGAIYDRVAPQRNEYDMVEEKLD